MAEHIPGTPMAGGFILATGVLAGAVIGVAMGQPTIGFLAGLGAAAAIVAAMWWRQRS